MKRLHAEEERAIAKEQAVELSLDPDVWEVETVDCPPNWPNMFAAAEAQARSHLAKEEGRGLVLEMLAFGARLYAQVQEYEKDGARQPEKSECGPPSDFVKLRSVGSWIHPKTGLIGPLGVRDQIMNFAAGECNHVGEASDEWLDRLSEDDRDAIEQVGKELEAANIIRVREV
ncbi:uncharacterized protein METZ01_LOCUS444835 [marine metagenome]|uniref:Uncharacterized protein n=1 Tax=marine metagenome TaxID=408172 RepID=A0A382Z918_9ZZZZ